MKDLMDILAVCFLFLVLGSLAYGFLMLVFNGLLSCLKFRIKLPVQKRFVGKMTPIYRLSTWSDDEVKRMYYIQKWDLEYVDIEMGSWQTIWIPFSSLFQRLQYVQKEEFNLGVLPDDVVATLDLEKNWQYEFNKWDTKNKKEQTKKDKFRNMMKNLNKDFNENYTE